MVNMRKYLLYIFMQYKHHIILSIISKTQYFLFFDSHCITDIMISIVKLRTYNNLIIIKRK